MVIAGLLTAGVGLALDAYAERQSARDQRRNAALLQQDAPHDAGTSSDFAKSKDELDALKELQNYADFQKSISDKILDDLAREEISMGDGLPPQLSYKDDYQNSMFPEYTSRSQSRKGVLPYPVVIPQGNSNDNEHSWPRAYVSSLMDSGIDQQAFLAFIDSFNESLRLSPHLDIINIARLASDIGRGESCFDLSTAIPAAVRLAKHAESDISTNKFIAQANDMLFRARGLFAMIVTSLPGSPLQTLIVDSENHLHDKQQKNFSGPEFSHNRTGSSAALPIFQDKQTSLPNRKLKKMSNFIADYSERRPRFMKGGDLQSSNLEQYTSASTSSTPLQQNLAHRKGPLSAFASSIANRHNNMEAQMRRKRRLRLERPLEQSSGMLRASAERASKGTDSPGTIVQADEASSDLGIQTGVLYLVVVNDMEIEAKDKWPEQSSSSRSQWGEHEWEDKWNTSLGQNSDIGAYSYENNMETAPPAYDFGTQLADGRSTFGI